MNRTLFSLIAAQLWLAAPLALAQEEKPAETSGSVSVGIRRVAASANDPSKLNEYRDLGPGTSGIAGFELRHRGDLDYFNSYGENLGRDDQYLDLNGGRYGAYRFRLYSDDMRHNFGSGPGARSPYSGIGSATLTATLPNPNVASWNTFDHSYKRSDIGAMFELQKTSPWYVRADVNEVKRRGVNVLAGSNGTSPGNGFMDLPAPIDYTTKNYNAEAGYSGRRAHVAASFLYSQFENNNDALRWSNGFFGNGLDTTVLPPDNQLTRFALNGNVRRLPAESTLAGRFTHSRLTSNVALQPTMLTAAGTFSPVNSNEPNFHGNVEKTTFSTSLASRPLAALETRFYYDYQKDENHSTELVFTPAGGNNLQCSGGPCTPELYHYKKNSYGAEAGYRVTRANKLSTGIEYAHVDRERVDFPKTNERKLFAEWKNSSLDALSARFKYQRLTRHSNFDDTQAAAFLVNPMDLYVRRFDLANVEQNLYKLVLDATPVRWLDLGVEAIVKRNNYPDTLLGRRSDTRQEYYASVAYGDPSSFRVLVFGDIELVKFESVHRVGTGNPNPESGSTATTYNWNSSIHDRSWQAGIGADWLPLSKLTVKSSLTYAETKGEVDFLIAPGGPGTLFPRIPNFHNSRRTAFSLRAIYDYSKQWELTGGYAYERYAYSDISYDNTLYVTAATTSASYVTGQYSFQPYSANIVYGVIKYRF